MKVKDLKRLLDKANPEAEVLLQGDPEGNHHAHVFGVAVGQQIHHFNSYPDIDREVTPDNLSTVLIVPKESIYA